MSLTSYSKRWTIGDIPTVGLAQAHGAYEAILLFLLLLIVEWIIPGAASLSQLSPHPFWLAVILLSVQYGSTTGLLVAVIATCMTWVVGWLPQAPQEDYYGYWLRIWREPVLWMLTAIVVGGLRNRQISQRATLEKELYLSEERLEAIAQFNDKLQNHIAFLERTAAVSDKSSVVAALSTLDCVRENVTGDIQKRFSAALRCWMGEVNWAFHIHPDFLTHAPNWMHPLFHGHGSTSGIDELMDRLEAGSRTLSVFNSDDARLLDSIGVFASPIRYGSATAGILVIKSVSMDRLVPEMALAVDILSRRLEQCLEEAPNIPADVAFRPAYPSKNMPGPAHAARRYE